MKKWRMAFVLGLIGMLLAGCANKPAVIAGTPPEKLLDADASALPADKDSYALYFRLGTSAYLAPEEREVAVRRDEPLEMELIRQLLAGPKDTQTARTPLFPQGTEVIATSKQGDMLFVTLNEAFLTGYSAEKSSRSGEAKQKAVQAERQLCLDALAATLTDAGVCTRVQVLIHRDQIQGTSMRLEEDYLYQNGSLLPLEPAVRREDSIYTPHNAAQHMLSLWMARDFAGLKSCIAAQGRPGEQQLQQLLESSPALTGFTLAPGQVSADGKEAIVTADISLYQDENAWTQRGYPFRMQRENGVWKLHYDVLLSIMAEE